MPVFVVTHVKKSDNEKHKELEETVLNQAAWDNIRQLFFVSEVDADGVLGGLIHTRAAAIDVLTHESTHAVIQYDILGGLPGENITGAINEGYADVFGCLKEENWRIGEASFWGGRCERNIAVPDDSKARTKGPSVIGGKNYIDFTTNHSDNGGVHTNSLIVSHSAYLMHKDNHPSNGLTWDELGKVW